VAIGPHPTAGATGVGPDHGPSGVDRRLGVGQRDCGLERYPERIARPRGCQVIIAHGSSVMDRGFASLRSDNGKLIGEAAGRGSMPRICP
jgi:hypothetical protein